MKKVRKAVIPAAGFGTRFLPATKALPKEMFPIVDTPALQYIVEEAVASGVTEILIVLGKNKKCIEDHFDIAVELEQLLIKTGKLEYLKQIRAIADMAHVHYVRQKEMNGSANAVLEAEAFIGGEPFAVMFGDDIVYNPANPCLGQLITAFDNTGKSILGCQNVSLEETVKYGIIRPGEVEGRYTRVEGIVEKPAAGSAPSTLASVGRFVFTPDVFDAVKSLQPNEVGETFLTDAIEIMAAAGGVYAYNFEGRRYDVGDKEGFIEATVEYALRDKSLAPKLRQYLMRKADELK